MEVLSRQWLILEGLKQRRVPEKERDWDLNLAWEFLAREEGQEETRRDETREAGKQIDTEGSIFFK